MNNIIKKGLDRADSTYEVSVVIDDAEMDVLDVFVPSNVSVKATHTPHGIYVHISGDAMEVMEAEVSLYELLVSSYDIDTACGVAHSKA
jgi:phage-related protein